MAEESQREERKRVDAWPRVKGERREGEWGMERSKPLRDDTPLRGGLKSAVVEENRGKQKEKS